MLRDLGDAIENAWDRVKHSASAARELLPEIDKAVVKQLFKEAFPALLSYIHNHMVRCRRAEQVRYLPDLNDALKFGRLFMDLFDLDNDLESILDFMEYRMHFPPAYFATTHSDHIQLGWDTLQFDFVHSHIFVDLNHNSYRGAKLAVLVQPNALHKQNMFSFERGILILQSQRLYCAGMAHFLEAVCRHGQSLGKDVGNKPADPEDITMIDTLYIARLNVDDLIPQVEKQLKLQQEEYFSFLTQDKTNIEVIDSICTWLVGDRDSSDPQLLEHAISIHVFSSMDRLATLHRLHDALKHLRSSLKAWENRRIAKVKILDARDSVETTLFAYFRALAASYLKNHDFIGEAFDELINDHQGDYLQLVQCEKDHIRSGHLSDFWIMYGLIEPILPTSYILSECGHVAKCKRDFFRAGVKDNLRPHMAFAADVFSVLYQMGTSYDPIELSFKSAKKLTSVIYPPSASLVTKMMMRDAAAPLKESDPIAWSQLLWSTTFICLEKTWAQDSVEEDERAYLRRVFGMQKRKRAPKPRAEEAEAATEAGEGDVDDGDAETAQNKAGEGADAAKREIARMRAKYRLFDANESLRDYGISENLRWGMEAAPRPSQFEEGLVAAVPKPPKRRMAVMRDEEAADALLAAALPEIAPPEPIEPLVFLDAAKYHTWRQIFPHPGENQGGRQRIRWLEFRRVLPGAPLNFIEERIGGVTGNKWRRLEGDGYEEAMVTLHMPHGGETVWLEREHLQTLQARFRHAFGWAPEDFVLREG
jgi:hypothetical protein